MKPGKTGWERKKTRAGVLKNKQGKDNNLDCSTTVTRHINQLLFKWECANRGQY